MKRDDVGRATASLVTQPCPTGDPNHQLVRLEDDALASVGAPAGSVIHVDRARKPRNGDLVWAELVRLGSIERLVRHYDESDGTVTLTVPDRRGRSIMRRSGEVLILGVAEVVSDGACGIGTT
jgi:hypothetical protein